MWTRGEGRRHQSGMPTKNDGALEQAAAPEMDGDVGHAKNPSCACFRWPHVQQASRMIGGLHHRDSNQGSS